MTLLTYLQFAFALPKRRYVYHWLYRRMWRAYATVRHIGDIEITMDGEKLAVILFFTAGGVIGIIVGLLTLVI